MPAQTLGTMGASPLEMAAVYATLDNHGRKVTPAVIKSAEHKDRTVEFASPLGEQIISREAADTVTSVLTGVVDDGTAKVSVAQAKNRKGQQVAGKTGTSDENKSAWFTGYTPGLVTSVGLFGEDTKARQAGQPDRCHGTHPGGRRPDQRWWLPGEDLGDVHLRRDGQGDQVRPGHHPGRGREADADAVGHRRRRRRR